MAQPYQRPGSAFAGSQQVQYNAPGAAQGHNTPPPGHYQQPSGGLPPSMMSQSQQQNAPPAPSQWNQAAPPPPSQPGWQQSHPSAIPQSQPPPMSNYNAPTYSTNPSAGQIPTPSATPQTNNAGPGGIRPSDNTQYSSQSGWQQAPQQSTYGNQQSQYPQAQQQHYSQGSQSAQAPIPPPPPQQQQQQQQQHPNQQQPPQQMQQPQYLQQRPMQQPQEQPQSQSLPQTQPHQQTYYRPPNPTYPPSNQPSHSDIQSTGPPQYRPPSVSQASPAQTQTQFQPPRQTQSPQLQHPQYNTNPPPQPQAQPQGISYGQPMPSQSTYGQQGPTGNQFPQGGSTHIGPPPPPIPAGYQHVASNVQPSAVPQPQYSRQELTHRYDPQNQTQSNNSQSLSSQRTSIHQPLGQYPQNIPAVQNPLDQSAPIQSQHLQQAQINSSQYNSQFQNSNQGPYQEANQPSQQHQGPSYNHSQAPPAPLSSPPPQQTGSWQTAPPPQDYQGNNSSPSTPQLPPGQSSAAGGPPQQYQQPQAERKRFTYIPPGNTPGLPQNQNLPGLPVSTANQNFGQAQLQQNSVYSTQIQQPHSSAQQQAPASNNQWQPAVPPAQNHAQFQNPTYNAQPHQGSSQQPPQNYQQSQLTNSTGNWQGQGGIVNQPGQGQGPGQNQGWDQRQAHIANSADTSDYQYTHQDDGEILPHDGTLAMEGVQNTSHPTDRETHRPDYAIQPLSVSTASKIPHQPVQERDAPIPISQEVDKKKISSKESVSPPVSPSILGPSALGGVNGPSDWEHFAAFDSDEDVDDTETFGAKEHIMKPVSNNALNVTAELPSEPSPPPRAELQRHPSSRISSEPDIWPTPPMPISVQPNRPVSQVDSIGHSTTPPPNQPSYAPTPPPKNDQAWGPPGRTSSVISLEAQAATPERSTGFGSDLHRPQPGPQLLYTAQDSSLADDAVSQSSFNTGYSNNAHHGQSENSGPGVRVEQAHQSPVIGQPDTSLRGQVKDLSTEGVMSTPQAPNPVVIDSHQPKHSTLMSAQTVVSKAVLMDRSVQTEPEETPVPTATIPEDPYAHLDPSRRDCLSRFAIMLQQEAEAASDQDRKKAFVDFVAQESKLRDIPYSSDPPPPKQTQQQMTSAAIATPSPGITESPSLGVITTSSPRSIVAVENRDGMDDGEYSPGGRPRKAADVSVPDQPTQMTQVPPQAPAQSAPNRALTHRKPIKAYSNPLGISPSAPPRPETSVYSNPISAGEENRTRSKDVIDGSVRPDIQHASSSESQVYKAYIPPAASEATRKQDIDFPDFKDSERKEEEFPDFISAPKKKTVLPEPSESQAKAVEASPKKDKKSQSPTARSEHAETFINPPHQAQPIESTTVNKEIEPKHLPTMKAADDGPTVGSSNSATPSHHSAVGDHAVGESETARQLAPNAKVASSQSEVPSIELPIILPPQDRSQNSTSTATKHIEESLSAFPKDSTFARETTEAWEARSMTSRNRREKERQTRQENQEEETDRLFSEDQIGYGDIAELEKEFKRAETERKSQEEKEEYDQFVRECFEPIYNKLQDDIKLLRSHEAQCFELMKGAVAGKNALDSTNSQARLVDCMKIFLTLHSQIEIRHARVLEAIQDRNKRYKRTVVQPLYAAGNITRMKQMEKHFDESEKKSALDASREKLARASRLMETVERGTMRGVGENLDYMEEITQAIQQLSQTVLSLKDRNYRGQPHVATQQVIIAESLIRQLTDSSYALMKSFHAAAQAVNSATYDVNVLSAKLSNADAAELDRILRDRDEEDARLEEDLKHRLSVVSSDMEAANVQGRTLLPELKKLKDSTIPETVVVPATPIASAVSEDPEHQRRIQRALEAAKKRNTIVSQ